MSVVDVLDYMTRKNKTNKPMFSVQNVLDCDTNSAGCNGGHPLNAFYYAYNSGLSDGTKYTYSGKNQTCLRSKYPSIYKLPGMCGGTLGGDEVALKQIIAQYGPFVALISKSRLLTV